jgi:rSAM/selenodomain-associated transferase 1
MTLKPPSKRDRCLAFLVRHPEPGKVKTRLAKKYGNAFAAELYGYFVEDLLEMLEPGNYHLEIFFTPSEKSLEIRQRFGSRFSYTPQEGKDLGARMKTAFHSCYAKGFTTVALIGSDAPDLTMNVIEEAFLSIESGNDAVVGPAFDGGYYLIGFHADTFAPAIFKDMPWGESGVFEKTVKRLHDRGYRIHLAPTWHDIDTEEDLHALHVRHSNSTDSHLRTVAFLRHRTGGSFDFRERICTLLNDKK